jgi:integrase-like protein
VRHLNLLRGRCEIGESATEVDGRLVWGSTKTYARRTVPLPRFLCDQFAAYLAERPHSPDDLVFTAPQGRPLREQKFVAGIFKPAAARAGLPHWLRFHDLRHTCASLLIAQGASVKAVQAQLGHASATVTLDRYGHLFPDELQQLADRLQEAYADAVADPGRTETAEAAPLERKEAGQRPASRGGGGVTRTPLSHGSRPPTLTSSNGRIRPLTSANRLSQHRLRRLMATRGFSAVCGPGVARRGPLACPSQRILRARRAVR